MDPSVLDFPPVKKSCVAFMLLALPAQAELLATFETTRGDIVVALQYDKTPQTVANFITLAQGSRASVDPLTGAVKRKRFYVGEKFFRVLDELNGDPDFNIAQTGSGTGANNGGPGYTFRDEFHSALAHVPYVLSMANGGPNTNGSQIFFTGNAPIPELDDVHTVFGLVSDTPSRAVIDAIIAAGNDATTITEFTIQRTDPDAVAFNEHAQGLPVVTRPAGSLAVTPGVSAVWQLATPMESGDIFSAFRSETLADGSWTEVEDVGVHRGLDAPPVAPAALDDAAAPRAFYHLSLAHHPNACAPSSLSDRTMLLAIPGAVLQYNFDSSGTAGNAFYSPTGGTAIAYSFNVLFLQTRAHDVSVVVENIGITPKYLQVKLGCDQADSSRILGRHATLATNNPLLGWSPMGDGNDQMLITR